MKILLIGDLHLRSLSDRPKWRLDNHYESQFQELGEIRDIAAANKVDMMVSLGDFFDNTRVSFQLVNDVVAWCKTLPCSLFSLIGNHDINAYVTSDRNNGLGVLMESQAIERLDELVFEKEKIVLRGIHAYLDPKQGDYFFDDKFKDYYKIVCSHNFCIPHQVPFDAVLPSQIKTNAQVLVFGHYHKSFSHFEGTTAFVNPGSISRWAINEQWQPQVFILDTLTGMITPHQLKSSLPASEIFDLASAAELKSNEMNLQNFVQSLESAQFTELDIEQVVLTKGKEQGILKEILDICLDKVAKAKEELR